MKNKTVSEKMFELQSHLWFRLVIIIVGAIVLYYIALFREYTGFFKYLNSILFIIVAIVYYTFFFEKVKQKGLAALRNK